MILVSYKDEIASSIAHLGGVWRDIPSLACAAGQVAHLTTNILYT